MQYFKQHSDLNFMSWETDPKLMNKNNIIGLIIHNSKKIEVGDFIFYNISGDLSSTYKVLDIVSKKDSSKKDYHYYYIKTENKKIPTSEAKRLYY